MVNKTWIYAGDEVMWTDYLGKKPYEKAKIKVMWNEDKIPTTVIAIDKYNDWRYSIMLDNDKIISASQIKPIKRIKAR